jgi:histidinol-phosphate aminotransferase
LIGKPALTRELEKARLPYNLCTLSQSLGAVALTELAAEIEQIVRSVRAERERLAGALTRLGGIEVTPSAANFLWLRCERPASEVFHALAERGVLVRSFHARGGRLAHQIRVTVGTAPENDRFLSALGEVV